MLNLGPAKVEDILAKQSRKLRIAMFSIHSCPMGELGTEDTGGMNVYIKELANELGKREHRIDVFTRFHGAGHQQITNISENVRYIHLLAGENRHISKLAIYPHLTDFFNKLETLRKQENLCYDMIHSHYWLSGRDGIWAQENWRIPHIVMFHTLGKVKNATGVGEKEPELRINSEKQLINSCNRIIATTERGKRELIRFYDAQPESISVVPCGVNLDVFQPMNKENARKVLKMEQEDTIILYVGRFAELKGLDRLLSAMTYLRNQCKPRLIIIGGDGPNTIETQRLHQLSNALGIEEMVSFIGRVDYEDLSPYYSAADLLVIPSHHESFGMVALESMACGTPVIATKVGAMEMLIQEGKTGSILPTANPERLAEKIITYLEKPGTNLDSGGNIRASIAAFAWSHIGDAMIAEYMAILNNWKLAKLRNAPQSINQASITSRI